MRKSGKADFAEMHSLTNYILLFLNIRFIMYIYMDHIYGINSEIWIDTSLNYVCTLCTANNNFSSLQYYIFSILFINI